MDAYGRLSPAIGRGTLRKIVARHSPRYVFSSGFGVVSGRVPPSSRAGQTRRAALLSERERAEDLFERFTGHDAEPLGRVRLPPMPKHLAVIGELDGVLYTTTRDGREENTFTNSASETNRFCACRPMVNNWSLSRGGMCSRNAELSTGQTKRIYPPGFDSSGLLTREHQSTDTAIESIPGIALINRSNP